ncbi:MAG TPA: (d)CMP kinase [Gammaproteobacteria bacterium]|nr:(d)CMP kinase [Gammaproteobacteria bacterium]
MSNVTPIVTIDGPSGSGKGTVSRILAEHLGWHMLDSGAIYRLLALSVLHDDCAFDDVGRIEYLAKHLAAEFVGQQVLLEGKDVSHAIRSEACGDVASKVAVIPEVRAALLDRLRKFAQLPGLVADGRDMGTVVFPDAFLKIFLDASVEERAKRRFLQLKAGGYNVNLQDLVADLMQRDVRDRTRAVAPLEPAQDAIIIESSNMGIQEVFEQINSLVQQHLSRLS